MSTRRIYEPFSAATFMDGGGGDSSADFAASACYLATAGITTVNACPTSIGHTSGTAPSGGKNLRFDVDGDASRSQPYVAWTFPSTPIREAYIAVSMRINTDWLNPGDSIKLWSVSDANVPNFDASWNWFTLQMYYSGDYDTYSAGNESGTHFGNLSGIPWLGQWNRFEHYIKYNTPGQSDGILRCWRNGVLSGELLNVNFWANAINITAFQTVVHFKSSLNLADPGITVTGHLDDIELWDGMPTVGPSAPSAPTNLRVVA